MPRITPYDYQSADVEALLAHNATGAVVAQVGAGKTVIGAELARRSGAPTKLIIAVRGTIESVWRATITGHTDTDEDSETYGEWIEGLDPEAQVRRIDGSTKGKESMDALEWKEPGYYLMTPQIFTRWKPLHLRPDFMLVDEVHLLGNRDAVGGKTLVKMARSAGSRVAMSGTFYRNNFENALTMMRFLYPERNDAHDIADINSERWIDDWCETEYDHFAPGQRRVIGELNPGRLAEEVPCWRQHFKREACCEFHPNGFLENLPEPVVIRRSVELTTGQKRAISQMQKDYLAYLEVATKEWQELPVEDRKKRPLVTKLPLVRQTRLDQMTLAMPSVVPRPWDRKSEDWLDTMVDGQTFEQAVDDKGMPLWDVVFEPDAESPKFDELWEIWKTEREPMVVASSSQKFVELAVNRLKEKGVRAFEWSGKATETARTDALRAFKAGEIDIIVAVTSAIGTGTDGLQMAAGILVSLSKSRDMTDEEQLTGRLDRRGQKKQTGVIHYEIFAEGSSEEEVYDASLLKRISLNRSLRRDIMKKKTNGVEDE